MRPRHSTGEEIVRNLLQRARRALSFTGAATLLLSLPAFGQAAPPHDGQHDFDFEIGTWHTHLSRLQSPLSGSTTWVQSEGTTVVRKVWGGRANLVELTVQGPSGPLEALSLRLYNPQSHQWSLNYSNARGGTMGVPSVGEFHGGHGEFISHEDYNGRMVLVRFVINVMTPDSVRFEQSFSPDAGKTWELNWVATDTRVKGAPGDGIGITGEVTRAEAHAGSVSLRVGNRQIADRVGAERVTPDSRSDVSHLG